jgi:hypothetical protein
MPNSGTVTAGSVALASQYNNLRADVLDVATGHTHAGTTGEGAKIEGTALKSTGATVGHFLKAGAGGTTTVWSGVEGTAIASTGATAGYVLTAGTGGTATTWAAVSAGGYQVNIAGTIAGTALGIPDQAYIVRNIGESTLMNWDTGVYGTEGTTYRQNSTFGTGLRDFSPGSAQTISGLSSIGTAGALPITLTSNSVGWANYSPTLGSSAVRDFAYGGGIWYAVTSHNSGTDTSQRSQNGLTFSGVQIGENINSSGWNAIAYGSGIFVVGSEASNLVYRSTDSLTWSAGTMTHGRVGGIVYGNGLFVAATYGGMQTSTNGLSWTVRTSAPFNTVYLRKLEYNGSLFVVTGNTTSGTTTILTSPDGTAWTQRTSASATAITTRDVAYGNGVWVIVGANGHLETSTTGTSSWTSRTSGFGATDIEGVAYANGRFVAGGGTAVRTSEDGITWTASSAIYNFNFSCVEYAGGRFLAGAVSNGDAIRANFSGLTRLEFQPTTISTVGAS